MKLNEPLLRQTSRMTLFKRAFKHLIKIIRFPAEVSVIRRCSVDPLPLDHEGLVARIMGVKGGYTHAQTVPCRSDRAPNHAHPYNRLGHACTLVSTIMSSPIPTHMPASMSLIVSIPYLGSLIALSSVVKVGGRRMSVGNRHKRAES